MNATTTLPTSPLAARGWVVLLLVLPWIHPWAPGPQPNTLPLLISWGCLAVLMVQDGLPDADELAQAWFWAALVSSVVGLLQYFGLADRLHNWMHVPPTLGEAMGNLRQRNQLATLTSLGAVAMLYWNAQGLPKRHALAGLALLAIGNAATNSRTGLLQWVGLLILQGLWQWGSPGRRPPWSWSLLLGAWAVYSLASLALPETLNLLEDSHVSSAFRRMGEQNGCSSRLVLWSNVLQLIGEHPWVGWGWDELKYAHYMAHYPGMRFCEILGNAHNLPLHLAFAIGIPATLLLVLVGVGLVVRQRAWQIHRHADALGWGVLAMIGLHSLLEYPLWYGPFQLAALFAVLLLWPAARGWLSRHRHLTQGAGIALLMLVALIGLDYHRMRQIYLPEGQRSTLWQGEAWTMAAQTWFFQPAYRFAELGTTPVTTENAGSVLELAQEVMHYSPEPRVITRLIDAARQSGNTALADWHENQRQLVYGK